MTSWIKRLFRPNHRTAHKASFQPTLEMLEDRTVPTTFSVTNKLSTGAGSLRQAILDANASTGTDVIRFTTGAAGGPIVLNSPLPAITNPITIDGSRVFFSTIELPNPSRRPLIEIDGRNAGDLSSGLALRASTSGSTIRGLVINNFDSAGILVESNNNTIAGNWLGVSFDGNSDRTFGDTGIRLLGNASNNSIGGATVDRNIVSGHFIGVLLAADVGSTMSNNTIVGNFIGTNAEGTAAIGNNTGVYLANGAVNTIVSRNVLSGNHFSGLVMDGPTVTGTRAVANRVGLASDGVSPLGNEDFGILVANDAHDNEIGGLTVGSGNLIAFNALAGLVIGSSPGNGSLANPAGVGNTALGNVFFAQPFFIDLGPNDRSTPNDNLDTDTGPNNLQNSVVLTGAGNNATGTVVQGTLNSTPNSSFLIQLFAFTQADANGTPLNLFLLTTVSANTDAAGNLAFSATTRTQAVGANILATATNNATGDTSEFNNQVVVANTPPMIRDDALSPDINEGEKATLSGRLIDPDTGDKLRLVVNWGDGSPVQTYHPGLDPFAFKHRYDDDGVYNVNFTWIDNHGGSNTRTRQVIVHNVEPELRGLDLSREHPRVHQLIVLSGRIVDSGDDTFTLTVNWGDGTTETIERERDGEFRLKHRYHQAGLFTIHLTLTDDDGGITDQTLLIDVG